MKRGTALAVVLGLAVGSAAGVGEIYSQTDWLDDPIIAEAAEWEPIPESDLPMVEEIGADPVRTHDVVTQWWEVSGEYRNDPDIPDEIEEAALIYGEMFNICPEFLMAICNRETGGTYRTDVKDETGMCWGCMQINIKAQAPRIKAYGLTKEDMLTADGAMIVAASYLAELFEEYGDPGVVLMKYNGATAALKKYMKSGQLNGYTAYVLKLSEELERRHGK